MKEKGGGSSHQKPLSSVTQAKMGIFCRYRARGRESSTKRSFCFLCVYKILALFSFNQMLIFVKVVSDICYRGRVNSNRGKK